MGKFKQRKHKARAGNPTGLPSVRDIDEEEDELGHGNTRVQHSVEELREMLQGCNVEERECAACVIANLAKDGSTSLGMLLEDSIIRTAAPLLLDKNLSVRHSVTGALRNISAISHDVCSTLVDYDVMTPLVTLLKEYRGEWKPCQDQAKIDSKSEIFYEAVHLLWNLCESGETAVSIFNRERLLDVLLPCLDVTKYGHRIAIAVAHCLHAVSEDNPELSSALKEVKPFYALCEGTSKEPSAVLLKVLSAGILVNLAEGDDSPQPPQLLPSVITIVAEALSLPVVETVSGLTQMVADIQVQRKQKHPDAHALDQRERSLEVEVNTQLDSLMAKQTALEILSNLCYGDGGSEAADDSNESDESSEGFEDVMDVEDSSQVVPLNMPCEAHEAIVSNNLVCKVMNHVNPIDAQVEATLKELPQTAVIPKRVKAVQCRSLLCIANLVQLLVPEDLGGVSGLCSTWTCLAQLAFLSKGAEDMELLESSTSACRSVLQSLLSALALQSNTSSPSSSSSSALPSVSEEELRLMAQVGLHCPEASVRLNVVRIMASLACLLRDSHPPTVLKRVGQYLLEVCLKDSDIGVVAEALDAVFDVFGEDSTDSVGREIELVPKLRQILPVFKTKINQNRKSLGSQYPVVMTAKTNLLRFIKYKSTTGVKNGKA
ncbi:HEAT repeat-containing protein 3-like [Ornithodoros turicata]|uniref:HEAT repeat-containing protein 3-like n=1 Tax=Ornithodoros turicata TaxID=34597 RepID=UPI0031398B8B